MITIRSANPADIDVKILEAAGFQGQWCNRKAEANTAGTVGSIEPVNAVADAELARYKLGLMLYEDLDPETVSADEEDIAVNLHVEFLSKAGIKVEDDQLEDRTPEITWSTQNQGQPLTLTVSGWPVPDGSSIEASGSATVVAQFESYHNGIVTYELV